MSLERSIITFFKQCQKRKKKLPACGFIWWCGGGNGRLQEPKVILKASRVESQSGEIMEMIGNLMTTSKPDVRLTASHNLVIPLREVSTSASR